MLSTHVYIICTALEPLLSESPLLSEIVGSWVSATSTVFNVCFSHKDHRLHTAPQLLWDHLLSPAAEWIPGERDKKNKQNPIFAHMNYKELLESDVFLVKKSFK